jgi:putative PEP-CTERM system TPR-repeat lipoprotein
MLNVIITRFFYSSGVSLIRLVIALGLIFSLSACGEKDAQEHYQEATTFIASDNKEAAIVALKNAIQIEPSMAKARFALGELYLQLNSFDSAGKELSFALDAGFAENEVIPALAEALHRTGANVALADLKYNESLLTPVQQLEVGFRKAQALIALNKQEESINFVNQLLFIDANSTYKIMLQALQLAIDTRNNEALEVAKTALVDDPLNRDAIDLTARLYLLNGDPQNAAILYENYIAVAPDDLEAKFALANMLLQQQQPQRAEKYIDALLKVNATNGALNQLKAIVRAADEDYENAKKFAEIAINSGRNDFSLRLVAGLASYQIQDYTSAIKHFSAIANRLPDNHAGLRMLAASQLELNMGNEAAQILARLSDISQNDLALFSRAGYELIKSGNTRAANQMLEQTAILSETADDLTQLGVLKLSLDNLEGIIDLEGAVAKAPDSLTAKNTLASAYLSTNQLQKALQLAKSWRSDEPNNIDAFMLEAEALQRQQEYSKAAALINAASRIDASHPKVQLAGIRLAIREERFEQALGLTKQFLGANPSDVTALAAFFQISLQLGDATSAINKIEDEAKNNLDNEDLVLLASRTMLATGRFTQALDILSNVEPSRLTPVTYWDVKGSALLNTNQLSRAFAHYQQWAGFFPAKDTPVIGQLTVLDAQAEFENAARLAADFVAKNESLQVTLMHAYFLAMSKDAKGATLVLNSLAPQFLSMPFVRGVKARIALLEKRGVQGTADAKAAYDDNNNANNLLVYVQTLDSAGKRDESLAFIQQHLQNEPNDARSKALLAERLIAKNPAAALRLYEEMIPKFPNNPILLNNAGYLHMQAKNLPKALAYSSRAFGISPDNIDYADTYAQILLRQGETDAAVKAYNSVIGSDVTNEIIILNYIESLLLNNDNSAARRKIQEFNSRIRSKDGKARLLILQATYMQ